MKQPIRTTQQAFTLIELLTVIAVIAALTSILLPALNRAKKSARALVCQSHLRAAGIAFSVYCGLHHDFFPPAYTYVGGGLYDQPATPNDGIYHWSGRLIDGQYLPEKALHCPELPQGGLPPHNTPASNRDPDQTPGIDGVIDRQAARCAFTVNEAICPRNRFVPDYQGTTKPSRLVKSAQVSRLSRTILLTEWPTDGRIVSGPSSSRSYSYLPVHGFRGLGKMAGPDRCDLNRVPTDPQNPCDAYGSFRKVDTDDLSADPSRYRLYPVRLDWVGRNHPGTRTTKNLKQSSFYYLDGHTEAKSVYETIQGGRFEWGQRVYSLTGGSNYPRY